MKDRRRRKQRMNNSGEETAGELVASKRGDYIQAKALYLAVQWLMTEDDIRKAQPSDIADMLEILEYKFPSFLHVFEECEKRGIQV